MDWKLLTIDGKQLTVHPLVTTNTGLYVHERNTPYYICLSYDTIVAMYDAEKQILYRTWPDWSATTAGHVRRFLNLLNSVCSTNYTYYDWKVAHDCEYSYCGFSVYSIRSRVSYTQPKMWCGYNAGRYYW